MDISDIVKNLRNDYSGEALDTSNTPENPLIFFKQWMEQALHAKIKEPNAFTLSTVNAEGKPSARIVLLRDIKEGLHFFTNYNSRKGEEMAQNPHVSATFFWPELERQIRVEGQVSKLTADLSDAYFHSRPIGNRIGAWASPQSQPLENRKALEDKMSVFESKYAHNNAIPRPEHWGGYALMPIYFEFWQGRPSRLHDRVAYSYIKGTWIKQRLAP